jgi:hypothetical protein
VDRVRRRRRSRQRAGHGGARLDRPHPGVPAADQLLLQCDRYLSSVSLMTILR